MRGGWGGNGAATGKSCYLGSFLKAVITFPFCIMFSLCSAAISFPNSLASFKHISLKVSNRSPFWPENLQRRKHSDFACTSIEMVEKNAKMHEFKSDNENKRKGRKCKRFA